MYYEFADDELCWTAQHFIEYMKEHSIKEMSVYVAKKIKVSGFFWCNEIEFVGSKIDSDCGKFCKNYDPRNGKSGCCKHYTTTLYECSDKVVTLKA